MSLGALSQLKLGLTVVGVVLFGYGVRADDVRLRWVGIAFLAVAVILRFVGRRRRDDQSASR